MAGPLAEVAAVTEAGRRLAGLALELLADRLELAGLELREAKLRLVQALVLALCAMMLLALALALAVVTVLLVLPPPWRPLAAGLGAGCCLLLGAGVLIGLRRRLARRPLAFAQTIEEIKKDRACF
ncbi:MAG: phage holin family protein [Desulfovibrionaceae bacterium]